MNPIEQIRYLQRQHKTEPVALELDNGRIIQIYDLDEIATNENGHGTIGILYDGGFQIFGAASVVSISVGVHPVKKEKLEKWRQEVTQRYGPMEDPKSEK
jgi:hypothetical protein